MQQEKFTKVSVCVITYNQEKYIRQCLQSIVDQETDFGFEVIVGDDCSTDGTRVIVREFALRYPSLVKPIYHEKNIGGTKNLLEVYGAAIGEYIAHMDGDDYMLPGKLKIQADELENNPDCTICFHAVRHFDPDKQRYLKLRPRKIPRKCDINYLLMNHSLFIHSSKMFRAECRSGLNLLTEELIDYYFHIHHALKGNIIYLDDVLGVYRINIGVATANNKNNTLYYIPNPKMLKLCIDAIEYAKRSGVDAELANKSKAKVYLDWSYYHLMANDIKNYQLFINRSYGISKLNTIQCVFKLFVSLPNIMFLLVRLRGRLRTAWQNWTVD